MLHNPAYAGAYVYGRSEYLSERRSPKTGKTSAHIRSVAQWPVNLSEHHPGYRDRPLPADPSWRLQAARGQPALCRIEIPIADVPHVDLSEHWISLAHSLKYCHCSDPKPDAQTDAPPGSKAESQGHRRQHSHQHQFAVAAQNLVGTVCGLVDDDLS
jgi:hypothetical protein